MYDIAIIGGGVNGCGIARDAAGRGLSVFVAEKGDLASGTSSASTKLIHGGLRYLEHYEFRLVRESLLEREVLLRMAPHIISPLRFVLPHHSALRPAWLIRTGLFLYDHLGGRHILPASHGIDLRRSPAGVPLKPEFTQGFEYSDCWVDDARLVVLNAIDAARRGADIRTRTELVSAHRDGKVWSVEVADRMTGGTQTVRARVLVNAAGPWVGDVLASRVRASRPARVRLVKGSHIVVPRLFEHDRAYIFQNADRRIVFAIPYEESFTLIGTTDVDYVGDPGAVKIDSDEIGYLCSCASAYFKNAIKPASVVWSYSGVRPLLDEGGGAAQEATRDFVLELDQPAGEPALLNVCGGKITTYRRLAEAVLAKLSGVLDAGRPWTAGQSLPGGDFPHDGRAALAGEISRGAPALDASLVSRLVRTYGTLARDLLKGAATKKDLGLDFGAGLTEREVRHLVANEWARTTEDILWRRTKLGLSFDKPAEDRLAGWLRSATGAVASAAK